METFVVCACDGCVVVCIGDESAGCDENGNFFASVSWDDAKVETAFCESEIEDVSSRRSSEEYVVETCNTLDVDGMANIVVVGTSNAGKYNRYI